MGSASSFATRSATDDRLSTGPPKKLYPHGGGREWSTSTHNDAWKGPEAFAVVPAEQLAAAVEAAEKATALAERYGEAIIAISAALPNENRVRAIIASLDTESGHV